MQFKYITFPINYGVQNQSIQYNIMCAIIQQQIKGHKNKVSLQNF